MKTMLLPLALAGVLASTSLSAATYDAVSGFSASNPSGPWTYGSGNVGTSSFTPFTVYSACEGTGIECWRPPVTVLGVPQVAKNQTSSIQDFATVVFPTDVLLLHPGQATDAIVNWTAPAAGTYNLTGFFELLDVAPTGVVTSVYNGSIQLYSQTLTGPAASFPATTGEIAKFSLSETLSAGSVLSFGVNNDGDFLNDSTGFEVDISPTSATAPAPEPSTVAIFGLGMIGISLTSSRRRFTRPPG